MEKYKNKASGIGYQPADVVDMDALTASVIAASEGKNFIEVVCYWYLPDEQRQAIMDHLREKCPGKTVLVFEGSDWNHHSYQAATMNDETLFVVLTKDRYLEHVEGIPDETLQENTKNLLDIAYATYETLKDKAVYLALRTPAVAETINDGGSATPVGGVDFRSVPLGQAYKGVMPVPQFVSQVFADGKQEPFTQVAQDVSAGRMPTAQEIKAYLAGCCQKKRAGGQVKDTLVCIAELLRLQEDMVCSAEPEIKEALAYLSS